MVTAILSLAVLGCVFGGLLAFASNVFAVEVDEREEKILGTLPGANCGGCGYPGCAAFAGAVVKGEAPINGCPVGGADVAAKVGSIMGLEVDSSVKKVALVHCRGTKAIAPDRYKYEGIATCQAANQVGGGFKGCQYGCLGLGDCVNACNFDALHIGEDGLPIVDKEKCVSCGKCVQACPRNLIELVDETKKVHVLCSSHDRGASVKKVCAEGCIGCGICAKACPKDAISIVNNLAVIDYDKCVNCGLCAKKCPMGTIINLRLVDKK